jgi:hypothetical protein
VTGCWQQLLRNSSRNTSKARNASGREAFSEVRKFRGTGGHSEIRNSKWTGEFSEVKDSSNKNIQLR